MLKTFTEEQERQIVQQYELGDYSCNSLAREWSLSPSCVYSILLKNNITIKHKVGAQRKYTLNEHYFDVIDDEHKAYWLGLLYADGCNKATNNTVEISLQERDKYILELFAADLSSNKPLYFRDIKSKHPTHHNAYILSLSSAHLSTTLTELGCYPRKSLTLEFPTEEQVSKKLINHFMRGYIDGDGCICVSRPKHRTTASFVSTFNFCESFSKLIMEELAIYSRYSVKVNKTKETTSRMLTIDGNIQVLNFLDWLYKDATIFLKRKYEKYLLGHQIMQELGFGKSKFITFNGKTMSISDWAIEVGLKIKTLFSRLSRGWTIEKSLTAPTNTQCRKKSYNDK